MAIVKAPLKWMHVVFVAVTARLAQVAPTPGLATTTLLRQLTTVLV